jgi:hypothetical protein
MGGGIFGESGVNGRCEKHIYNVVKKPEIRL